MCLVQLEESQMRADIRQVLDNAFKGADAARARGKAGVAGTLLGKTTEIPVAGDILGSIL